MKLKRDEFKVMLKECILELVQEGKLFQGQMMSGGPVMTGPVQEQYGNPGMGGEEYDESMTPNTQLDEAVRIATQQITKGDPKAAGLYHSIIADTARTTLQEQLAGERGMGGIGVLPATAEERELDQAQLGLFAASNRWAHMAFAKKT